MKTIILFAAALSAPVLAGAETIFTYESLGLPYLSAAFGLLTFGMIYGIRILIRNLLPKRLGFISLNPDHPSKFVAFDEEKDKTLERVIGLLAGDKINIYSNLSKMELSLKNGSLQIEDNNIKISFLVNRRRYRSYTFKHGDIMDIGDLTLMVNDPSGNEKNLVAEKSRRNLKINRSSSRLLKNTPALIPTDHRRKSHYLTKNVTFVGRSDENDLVIKVMDVNLRHAKIQRVANRYKITGMNGDCGTFVNGKRIEEKYLSDNDLITFESVQYRFSGRNRPAAGS